MKTVIRSIVRGWSRYREALSCHIEGHWLCYYNRKAHCLRCGAEW